ncbi:MAG: hypothetical protein JEZ03_03720 [Bacteroidales bacterium]|nr:hypothetical protein [Bacteroidales bacterium]
MKQFTPYKKIMPIHGQDYRLSDIIQPTYLINIRINNPDYSDSGILAAV